MPIALNPLSPAYQTSIYRKMPLEVEKVAPKPWKRQHIDTVSHAGKGERHSDAEDEQNEKGKPLTMQGINPPTVHPSAANVTAKWVMFHMKTN